MKKTLLSLAVLTSISVSSHAVDYQAGDIVVRGGATLVNPDSNRANVALNGDDSVGLQVSVDDNTQLGLNGLYFFDRNWAVELLAATPFTHDITVHDKNAALGVDGAKLAEVTHLPPTVSAIYYFDSNSNLKPYIGAGINYTVFFEEEFDAAPKSLGFNELSLDSSFGLALQVGADYYLDNNWHVNASVRYIDIDTEATFKVGNLVNGSADVSIDPMVYSLMIGYKF
ncbi:OmpW/AlkL family protein [Thalassotalea fusca]